MDIINEYLKRTRNVTELPDGVIYEGTRPCIKCKDGFIVSVQAGEYWYCYPRINGADRYTRVELGFPVAEDEVVIDYAEDPGDHTDTVYCYVPVDIVVKLVERHGGIVN